MLASLSPLVPSGHGWAYELKWDGMRASILVNARGRFVVASRRGRDYTACFPELQTIADVIPADTILDGEIVVLDAGGQPDFDRIQDRWHRPKPSIAAELARTTPVTFVAFDVLWLAGRSLLESAYENRREKLYRLAFRGPRWFAPDEHREDGEALFAAAAARGLEGIVAKRLSSPYRPGQRSGDWLKVKNYRIDRFIVGGWLPGEHGGIEALLVGRPSTAGDLAFAGTVEFGLNGKRRELAPALELLSCVGCPFLGEPPRRGRWVQPRLAATVRFIGWNRGVLREAILTAVDLA
jgi:bifunctional non-homologous end joining protein LigD